MLRCAKDLGLKARARRTSWERLASTPLPGIAVLRDGGYLILGKAAEDKVLLLRPSSPRPETMTPAGVQSILAGSLLLIAGRASLTEFSRPFRTTCVPR